MRVAELSHGEMSRVHEHPRVLASKWSDIVQIYVGDDTIISGFRIGTVWYHFRDNGKRLATSFPLGLNKYFFQLLKIMTGSRDRRIPFGHDDRQILVDGITHCRSKRFLCQFGSGRTMWQAHSWLVVRFSHQLVATRKQRGGPVGTC